MTYINKLEGTVSPELNQLTKEFWLWCMERVISVQAQHLPGVLNTTADKESRIMKDRTDWMLCPRVFQEINKRLGSLQMDLFCNQTLCPTSRVCQLEARPRGNGNRYIHVELGRSGGAVCKPPLEHDRQSSVSGETTESGPDLSGTSLETTTMVSNPCAWIILA